MRRIMSSQVLFFSLFLVATASAQTASSQRQPVLDLGSIDQTVDPCTDFYTYACGAWIKKNPIPPDQSRWSVYSKMADDNKLILRDILESAAADPKRDAVKQKIGDYYAACTDEKKIEAAGGMPLNGALEQIAKLHSKQAIGDVAGAMVQRRHVVRIWVRSGFQEL